VSEASDLANTEINPTEATITASEVGVMTTLTDLGRDTASRDVAADIGKLFGEAIAKKVDADLSALFGSFAGGNDLGAAGTELTPDLLLSAEATLRSLNIPRPYYGVFSPKAMFNLKKALANAGYSTNANAMSDIGNETLRNGYVGTVFGIDLFENANIAADVNDDIVGGVFHPQSLGLAMKSDFKIETQRDASLRATEIVGTVTYGTGVIKDDFGCQVTVDGAL
jgi:hypothetical protein